MKRWSFEMGLIGCYALMALGDVVVVHGCGMVEERRLRYSGKWVETILVCQEINYNAETRRYSDVARVPSSTSTNTDLIPRVSLKS